MGLAVRGPEKAGVGRSDPRGNRPLEGAPPRMNRPDCWLTRPMKAVGELDLFAPWPHPEVYVSHVRNPLKAPETEHVISVGKLNAWLDGGGKSPNEQVTKQRLKAMLGK